MRTKSSHHHSCQHQHHSPYSSQLVKLKNDADHLLAQITNITKWTWSQKFSRFLISIMTNYNHSFVSQFTILYKSYMIVVAFVLTILCNFLWMKYGNNGGMQSGKRSIVVGDDNLSEVRNWIQNLTMILPLKGRFSIVFFQLMFLTSIQIVYQTIIQLHYRFNKKKVKFFSNKCHQSQKSSLSTKENINNALSQSKLTCLNKQSQNQKAQQQTQKNFRQQQTDNQSTRIHYNSKNVITTPALEHWQSSEILTSLLELFNGLKCTQLKIYEYKLPQTFKEKQFTYNPLLFSTKFLYLFSLLYMENFIWQGIVIKQWKSRITHLVIILSCVVEFIIWNVINVAMEGGTYVAFSGKQIIEIGSHGQISLGMY